MKYRQLSRGFALPTVVISSLVLFAVLIAVMSTIASLRTALDAQYYESLAADAAESGTVHVNSCLLKNSYIPTWNSSNLRPNTNCNGGAACTNAANCFVVKTPNYRSTYVVDPVSNTTGVGAQIAKVTGTTDLLKTTDGSKWKTYTKVTYLRVGAGVSAANVKLGYEAGFGSFFGTLGSDGRLRMAGYNQSAQLGNGTSDNTLVPAAYGGGSAPFNAIRQVFTSASGGSATFVKTADGKLYAAGLNANGQLGIGTISGLEPSPKEVILPANVDVEQVLLGNAVTYYLLKDKSSAKKMVYASGECKFGLIGDGTYGNSCTDQPTPKLVNIVPYSASNPDTHPIAISSDLKSSYALMESGKVYGWGMNDIGQLGTDAKWADGNTHVGQYSTPIRVSVYGDAGKPKATQIVTDGYTLFVRDSTGTVTSVGNNGYGSMGNKTALYNTFGWCMSSSASWADCNSTDPTQMMQFIYTGTSEEGVFYNPQAQTCLTAPGTKNGNNRYILTFTSCPTPTSPTNNQKFVWHMNDDRTSYIKSVAYANQCLGAGDFALDPCATSSTGWCNWYQYNCFRTMAYSAAPVAFNTAGFGGNKSVKQMATDYWSLSLLTEEGEVWSAGNNDVGQFGGGAATVRLSQSNPTKFMLPAGVKGVDINETNYGDPKEYFQNLYVVGDNGKVYGAGSNFYGQLGNGLSGLGNNSNPTPVAMNVFGSNGIMAKNVETGYGTAVIFTDGGRAYSVGNNTWGQLGDGTTTHSSVPISGKYLNEISPQIY